MYLILFLLVVFCWIFIFVGFMARFFSGLRGLLFFFFNLEFGGFNDDLILNCVCSSMIEVFFKDLKLILQPNGESGLFSFVICVNGFCISFYIIEIFRSAKRQRQ